MMTAAATTAATTATISAANASMNADGDMFKQMKTITTTSVKDTTSEESIKNMAISAAIAGVATWAMQASGGEPNLETGNYADSKVGVNVEQSPLDGKWYFEGTNNEASWFDTYVTGNQNPAFKTLNATTPTVASGANGHDLWIATLGKNGTITSGTLTANAVTVTTAPTYLIVNACAAAPSACAIYVNTQTDNNFLNQRTEN